MQTSTDPSVEPPCPTHGGVPQDSCNCQPQQVRPHTMMSRQDLRLSMRRGLQNSFDKESTTNQPGNSGPDLLPPLPKSPPRYSSTFGHTRSTTVPQISPMMSQMTLNSTEPEPDLMQDLMRPRQMIFSQNSNVSTLSVQTKSSASDQVSTTRGRRWLEHHA